MVKHRGLSSLINLICILLLFVVMRSAAGSSVSLNTLFIQIGYSIIMATSLNLACGYLGELPLGHAGFMSVGAYTAAVLTTKFLPQSSLSSSAYRRSGSRAITWRLSRWASARSSAC